MPDDELTPLDQYISRMKPKPDLSRSKSQGLKDKKHLEQSPFFFLQNPTEEGLFWMYRVHLTGSSTSTWSLVINVLCTGYLFDRPINRWALEGKCIMTLFLQSFIQESMAIELSLLKAISPNLMCTILCLMTNSRHWISTSHGWNLSPT
jgi:hypothetical protein